MDRRVHRLPSARVAASGIERNLNIATVPAAGPIARMANATPHPNDPATMAPARWGTMVIKNPRPISNVRLVPL